MQDITKVPVEFVPLANIRVGERARKEFTSVGLQALSEAISSKIGMLHPILILTDGSLLTGERRLRVITDLHSFGTSINFAGNPIPYNTIPAIRVTSAFDAVEYLIAEENENTARVDFTWAESAALTKRIVSLQQLKLDASKADTQQVKDAVAAIMDDDLDDGDYELDEFGEAVLVKPVSTKGIDSLLQLNRNPNKVEITRAAVQAAAMQIHGDTANAVQRVQADLKMADALEIPELREKLAKAPNRKEADKIVLRHEKDMHQRQLAHAQGKKLRTEQHKVFNGDCLEVLRTLPPASIDVCLTDPIYGINAHKFGVAERDLGNHKYEDTPEMFNQIMPEAIALVSKALKPAAHMYLFCDLIHFYTIKGWIESCKDHGEIWNVQKYPVHYVKMNGSRCPVPGFSFRKNVEYIVFAWRGGKQSNSQLDSTLEVTTKRTEINGANKEPEALKALLNNSAFVGDTVLDFMAGTGATAIAAHECKMKSISIEIDTGDYGRILERLKEAGAV